MFKGYAKPPSTCLCVPAFVSKAPQMSLLPISHPVPAVSVSLPHFASRYRRCQPFATHAYSPWLPFVLVQLVHPTPLLTFLFHLILFFAFFFAGSSRVFHSFSTRLLPI
jgi:hypothetical protein